MFKTFSAFFLMFLIPSYGFSDNVSIWGNISYGPVSVATAKTEIKRVLVKCGEVQKVAKLTPKESFVAYEVDVSGPGKCTITFIHKYGANSLPLKIKEKSKRVSVKIVTKQMVKDGNVTYIYDLIRN